MPKQKTHKGLAKRVKVTGTGKVLYKRAGLGHLNSGKAGRRKINLRRRQTLVGGFATAALEKLCAN